MTKVESPNIAKVSELNKTLEQLVVLKVSGKSDAGNTVQAQIEKISSLIILLMDTSSIANPTP